MPKHRATSHNTAHVGLFLTRYRAGQLLTDRDHREGSRCPPSIAVNLSTMGGGKKRKNAIVSMEEMASNAPQAQEKPSKRSKKITQLVK